MNFRQSSQRAPKHIIDEPSYWPLFFAFAACIIIVTLPSFAFATTESSIGRTLCKSARLMSGNVGKGVATVGIAILGVQAVQGKLTWVVGLLAGAGIATIFSAATIVNYVNPKVDPRTCVSTAKIRPGTPSAIGGALTRGPVRRSRPAFFFPGPVTGLPASPAPPVTPPSTP